MKFEIQNTVNSARLGKISGPERLPNVYIETPAAMLYTKGGSIPHITHEVLKLISNDTHMIQVPLSSTVQFIRPLSTMGDWQAPLAQLVGLTDCLICVTVQDPGDISPAGKYNKQDTVAIWTRSGKVDVDTDKYIDMIETFRPDMYYFLSDGDTTLTSSKKRVQKSVDHTITFFKRCLQRHMSSPTLRDKMVMAPIAGGFNLSERERCIRSILQQKTSDIIGGFLIDGLHNNGPELEFVSITDVKLVVDHVLKLLPTNKLRSVHGCWNPVSLLELVELGVDLFDMSFPYIVTERSAALTFSVDYEHMSDDVKFEINLRNSDHINSFKPILIDCRCLTCRKYTRAYISHLINVEELLGPILLTIHNLHHYLLFFAKIRESISENKLSSLKEWIKKQFDDHQNSLLKNSSDETSSNV